MGIFKNNNEVNYVGGKKHFTDVLKNRSESNYLIYRQPEEDFNNNSTLIVMPGEEAIFLKNGQLVNVFREGNYKLNTNNYPFLSRIKNMFSGGVSTYNCVVYFVRKTITTELLWGTSSPIVVRDKVHGIVTEVKAHGAYKIYVNDGLKVLSKVVGGSQGGMYQEDMDSYFENEFQGLIVAALSKYLNALDQEMIGIQAQIPLIQQEIIPDVSEILSKYGFGCQGFTISGLDVDLTKYNQLDESVMNDITKVTNIAIGKANAKRVMGDDWGQITSAEILEKLAQNPGAGGIAAAGGGMMLGASAMNIFGQLADNIVQPIQVTPKTPYEDTSVKKKPRISVDNGGGSSSDDDEFEKKIRQLKIMLKHEVITKEEYDAKIAEILSRM